MKIVFDHEIFTMQKYGGISNYLCCNANEIIKKKDLNIVSPLLKSFYLSKNNLKTTLFMFGQVRL